jgi:anaerobic magnesium-protoporphyrin IX monomethyl ester cyclase
MAKQATGLERAEALGRAMRVLLINPPYQTLTSNLGVGHQVPLGLLMIGGALLDHGHEVRLLDAEAERLSIDGILERSLPFKPTVIMTGHAGSTPAHPVCVRMLQALKQALPSSVIVYGGVYPTYHAREILMKEAAIDVIVRGEGEATIVELLAQLEHHSVSDSANATAGLCFRSNDKIIYTVDRPAIRNLDDYRIGWELIEDWDRYQCFGLGRAAIIQLSRGCPHRCTYCGQHGFWISWRHRDPVRVADEIQWLHDTHGVRFITLADENPTTLPEVWRSFLEEVASRNIDVHFFATIRATDIVRDEAILPLYRSAGLLYILMGVDTVDEEVQAQIRKNSTLATDRRACQLLRQNGIFAMLGYIVGFEEENWRSYRRAQQRLKEYDADLLNAMFVTPHRWTPFADEQRDRRVIQSDLNKWDYRHQVLAHRDLATWKVFAGVKWLELCFHLHPRRLRSWLSSGPFVRRQIAWCFFHTGLVWLGEILEFVFATRTLKSGPTLGSWQSTEPDQDVTLRSSADRGAHGQGVVAERVLPSLQRIG